MLPRKAINKHDENRLKNAGDILASKNKIFRNSNLNFLLKKRYDFVSKHLTENDEILELGCGAGHSRYFIKNKNLKISDITDYDFLDYKNVDCLNTGFKDNSFDAVFSSSLIHHIPNPIKLFNEVGRILKKNGKYIILDVNCSFFFKLIILLTKIEKYDVDVNIYDKNINLTDPKDHFDSNNAVPSLIFENFDKFNNNLDFKFKLTEFKFEEFFIFANSGGVIIDAPHIPLNNSFNNFFNKVDEFLSKFHKIFPLHMYVCLTKS